VCTSFANENLIDVIEIDAASHTGVDNIREIIEKAQFQPTQAKYKIYIIDEVHMLSKGAFNALLKILEEPPVHVKFILATTEIHKVPDTILSRCQRYDFKNFSDEDITSRLKYIASEESVSVDDASYQYIVKNSEG
jgi:DNA polymerase-3 subunit gamma/tau